jgi:hypothetical protein
MNLCKNIREIKLFYKKKHSNILFCKFCIYIGLIYSKNMYIYYFKKFKSNKISFCFKQFKSN